jgi:hypothetical protein
MRRIPAFLSALLVLAGCASPTKEDAAGTRVQRTKISTSSGGALDAERAPEQPTADDPNAKCVHAFEHIRQGTHAWMDESDGVGMVSLCTPIECRKCGEIRHECTIGRIPGNR